MTEYTCSTENCGCGPPADMYDVMESRLMQMTFWAHKEVLFDKIKQKIEKEQGEKLEKIAELLVEASKNKWKTSQEAEKRHDELRGKLKDAFEE